MQAGEKLGPRKTEARGLGRLALPCTEGRQELISGRLLVGEGLSVVACSLSRQEGGAALPHWEDVLA